MSEDAQLRQLVRQRLQEIVNLRSSGMGAGFMGGRKCKTVRCVVRKGLRTKGLPVKKRISHTKGACKTIACEVKKRKKAKAKKGKGLAEYGMFGDGYLGGFSGGKRAKRGKGVVVGGAKKRKPNSWIKYVKEYAKAKGISYGDAISQARSSYHKLKGKC